MADRKNNGGDVVDLIGKKEDTGAAKKSPAAAKKPAGQTAKKKSGAGGVIAVLILLILIGGFIFEEIQFNLLGVRDIFVENVAKLDPEHRTYEELYLQLSDWEAALNKREKALDSRETQLDTRQTELDQRDEELQTLEERLTPIYRQPMTEQELADMKSLSKTYSEMSPDTAADILSWLYDTQDMAAILYYMSERSAAAILAVMDIGLAAEITEILMYY